MSEPDTPTTGSVRAAISKAVVHVLSERTGKGPTKAKTTIGGDGVFVVLEDNLTKGERNLVEAGEWQAVLAVRARWQQVMREEMSRKVEELTGRKVVSFLSDNHLDPDIAVEVFVLERVSEPQDNR